MRLSSLSTREAPPTQPETSSGACRGSDYATFRDGVYQALQRAVEVYPGGIGQLAEDMGAGRQDTYLRIGRREDSKGNLQRAFIDHLAHVVTCPASAQVFMVELARLLGFEAPVSRKRVADDEVGRAFKRMVERMSSGMRDGILAELAVELGVSVEQLK